MKYTLTPCIDYTLKLVIFRSGVKLAQESRTGEEGLPNLLGLRNAIKNPHAEHAAVEYGVCPAGFVLSWSDHCCAQGLLFVLGVFTLYTFML